MVLEEPLDINDGDLVPSFKRGVKNIRNEGISRSKKTIECLIDFEEIVVPKMIESEWMNLIAKSKSKPYYNKTEQNLNSHIFPGVEIAADIVEQAPDLSPKDDLRDILSLWVIHDTHKIVSTNKEEFNITMDKVSRWISVLSIMEFNDSLSKKDYHSCAVALHNEDKSNIDDSTNRFTELRPVLRLIDATVSIKSQSDFVEQAEIPVSKVFSDPNKMYVPSSHKVEFNDPVIRTIVSESIYNYFMSKNYYIVDIRNDGVLYARPEDSPPISDPDNFVHNITDESLDNIRKCYQVYTNKSFLGSGISSPISRSNYNRMPTVYEISDMSHVCLSKTEIIQRIVQAAIEQQSNRLNISQESMRQIEIVERITNKKIRKDSMIEGLATLVHTVYRDIIPKIIDSSSSKAYERTMEGAILYVFNMKESTQNKFIDLIESDEINASPINWPYKYLIAQELHRKFGTMSKSNRQKNIIKMLLEKLDDFKNWDEYGDEKVRNIREEFCLRVVANCSVDGNPITSYDGVNFLDMMHNLDKEGDCHICGTATSQNAKSPNVLSNKEFDTLNQDFITDINNDLTQVSFGDSVPKNPLCILCQMSISIRSQQINSYDSDNKNLHVTVYPINSTSIASYTRFNKILTEIRTKSFANKSGIEYHDIGSEYKSIISNYLRHTSNIDAFVDRENAFDVSKKMDEASSQFSLPENTKDSVLRGVSIITISALISGLKVCITREPQLFTKTYEKDSIVNYGPNIRVFNNIIKEDKSISSLPRQIKTIDRLISIGDKMSDPSSVLESYASIKEGEDMLGTRLYNSIAHDISDNNIRSICVDLATIDALNSENTSNNLLNHIAKTGRKLGQMIETEDIDKIQNILYETLILTERKRIEDPEEFIEDAKDYISDIDGISVKENEKNFEDYILSVLDINNRLSDIKSKRRLIIAGSEIRAIIKHKDKT